MGSLPDKDTDLIALNSVRVGVGVVLVEGGRAFWTLDDNI
jgi:hypothetical protein